MQNNQGELAHSESLTLNYRISRSFRRARFDQTNVQMTTHFRVELEQQLIPCQEVLFWEQLHVLAYVLHVLDRVNLAEDPSEPNLYPGNTARKYMNSYLLLIMKLVGLNVLDLLVDSEIIEKLRLPTN